MIESGSRKADEKIEDTTNSRKILIETYEPELRIPVSKEHAVPILFRVCNSITVLGGTMSFFASSLLVSVKEFFKIREKIKSTDNFKIIRLERK